MSESTNQYTKVDLKELGQRRKIQPSFHIFSEQYVRGQIFNYAAGEEFPSLGYDGNVLVTVIEGEVEIQIAGQAHTLETFWQILINPRVQFSIKALTSATFQIVWTPPFAKWSRTSDME